MHVRRGRYVPKARAALRLAKDGGAAQGLSMPDQHDVVRLARRRGWRSLRPRCAVRRPAAFQATLSSGRRRPAFGSIDRLLAQPGLYRPI